MEAALEPIRAQVQENPSAHPALLLERDLDLVGLYSTWTEELLDPEEGDGPLDLGLAEE